jgi:hypothetical protein
MIAACARFPSTSIMANGQAADAPPLTMHQFAGK